LGLPRLERIERRAWQPLPITFGRHREAGTLWRADGDVVAIGPGARGDDGVAAWTEASPPPRAPGRQLVGHLQRDAWDVYDSDGKRIVTFGLRAGGGWVERPDGQVTCEGGGCSRYRRTLPDWTSAPVEAPGCVAARR